MFSTTPISKVRPMQIANDGSFVGQFAQQQAGDDASPARCELQSSPILL